MTGAIFIQSLIISLLIFSSSVIAGEPLKKVTFMPLWSAQAQFAGYYVAVEKGFYRKYGLDVSILPGGPHRSSVDFLREKKVDLVMLWLSTAIEKRAQGLKLVNIGQIVQKSALMLVAKKSSGIKTYSDISNRKVSLWKGDFSIQPRLFFKKYNLLVSEISQSNTINLFLRGGSDVASAMWYNEYHTILNSGLDPGELVTFFFYDHELNFPEDGIYMLEETFRSDPDVPCAFIKASIDGWLYAFEHKKEAVDITLKYMQRQNMPANRVHQQWMLERMKDLIMPDEKGSSIGGLKREDYDSVSSKLLKEGIIRGVPDFQTFSRRCI
jgi:NitT/TauT family transport system substrate-binding protein